MCSKVNTEQCSCSYSLGPGPIFNECYKKVLLECEVGLENAVRDEADVEDEEEYNDDGIK